MLASPNGRLVSELGNVCVSALWVIGFQVKYMELGFKGGYRQLVLSDVWPIELQAADTVLDVSVPPQAVGF